MRAVCVYFCEQDFLRCWRNSQLDIDSIRYWGWFSRLIFVPSLIVVPLSWTCCDILSCLHVSTMPVVLSADVSHVTSACCWSTVALTVCSCCTSITWVWYRYTDRFKCVEKSACVNEECHLLLCAKMWREILMLLLSAFIVAILDIHVVWLAILIGIFCWNFWLK